MRNNRYIKNKRRNNKLPKMNLTNQLWTLPTKDQRGVKSGPFPNCMDVLLKTNYWNVVLSASPFLLVEFRLNDPFNPYTGAINSASGFLGASVIYDSYKVRSVGFDTEVISNEAFAMSFGIFLRDAQPSTLIATYDQAVAAIANGPVCCTGTVGSTQGTSKVRRNTGKIDIGRIVGDTLMYLSDRDYSAAITASPNQVVWGAFILVSDAITNNLANGVSAKITMSQNTCFFSKTVIL